MGPGHTWMKFHCSPFQNVVAQTAAIQAAAPPGFKALTPGRDRHFRQRNDNGYGSDITVQIPKR